MDGHGLTTGNTLYDLLILVGFPALAVAARHLGITAVLVWLGEQLVKLKPSPSVPPGNLPVAPVAGDKVTADARLEAATIKMPVAFDWAILIQLLLPSILKGLEALFQRSFNRPPNEAEMQRMRVMVAEDLQAARHVDVARIVDSMSVEPDPVHPVAVVE